MKSLFIASAASLLAAAVSAADTISNANTPPVTISGNAFISNGKRFYIRGIDYQPGGSSNLVDPLANPTICKRDIAKFKELGVNTVRIYSVDNAASHDECMKLLADAGIYLAVDVNSPKFSLNRGSPGMLHKSYNEVYLQNVFATIDTFAKYDNTLLFFSANEVIDAPKTTFAAPYIKAVGRDMKDYLKARKYRQIPVGYSAADVAENRYQVATYMNCGSAESRSDFFAFNDYSWCNSNFEQSGWSQKVKQYQDYSQPIFLSEYGCNTNPPRKFGEVAALYSDKMTGVYSGGLIYEYSMENNKFGMVNVRGDSVQELPEFQAFKAALAATASPTGDGGYRQNLPPSQCPKDSPSWPIKDTSLPLIPEGAKKFMQNGAGAGPGIKNQVGSQDSGTPSPGWTDGGNGSQKAAAAPASNANQNNPRASPNAAAASTAPATAKPSSTGTAKANGAVRSAVPVVLSAVLTLYVLALSGF